MSKPLREKRRIEPDSQKCFDRTHTQLENLLHLVWKLEKRERIYDRIDGAVALIQHHKCHPPIVGGNTCVKEWACPCGQAWKWHHLARAWHPAEARSE